MNFLRLVRRVLASEDRAQAGMELLIVLPVFIVLLGLVVDFGVIMYQYVSLSNATREGARYAAVNCGTGTCASPTATGTTTSVCYKVVNAASGLLDTSHSDVKLQWVNRASPANVYDKGDSVVVQVSHDYGLIFAPGIHWTIKSSADMRLEQTDGNTSLPSSASMCS
jgi:Flp pilus assembly protein TadG